MGGGGWYLAPDRVSPPLRTYAAGSQLTEEEVGLLRARPLNQREREYQEDILKIFFLFES